MIEVDAFDHSDINIDYEIQRQKAIEKNLDCEFIRVNPDEQNFDVFKGINKIPLIGKVFNRQSFKNFIKNKI